MARMTPLAQSLVAPMDALKPTKPRSAFVEPAQPLAALLRFGSLAPKALAANHFTGASVPTPYGTLPHPVAAPEFHAPALPAGSPAAVSLAPFLHTEQGGEPTPTTAGPFPGQHQSALTGPEPPPHQGQLSTGLKTSIAPTPGAPELPLQTLLAAAANPPAPGLPGLLPIQSGTETPPPSVAAIDLPSIIAALTQAGMKLNPSRANALQF